MENKTLHYLLWILFISLIPAIAVAEENKSSDFHLLGEVGRGFSLHKQNYIIPLTWTNHASHAEDAELKFQISIKQEIGGINLFIAYTQKSFWRILDDKDSRPFRETNYNPEIFYRLSFSPSKYFIYGADAGYEHESNGAREPVSRSWDRIYIKPFIEYKTFKTILKIWYRLPEDEKDYAEDPHGDENPDIDDYYGYGELTMKYQFPNDHLISAIGRWNFKTEKGGGQFDYSLPFPGKNIFFLVQAWTGYGESLIDYNKAITRYGMGIMVKR